MKDQVAVDSMDRQICACRVPFFFSLLGLLVQILQSPPTVSLPFHLLSPSVLYPGSLPSYDFAPCSLGLLSFLKALWGGREQGTTCLMLE